MVILSPNSRHLDHISVYRSTCDRKAEVLVLSSLTVFRAFRSI